MLNFTIKTPTEVVFGQDIEDGIVVRELKRIYNEYCGGGSDGKV